MVNFIMEKDKVIAPDNNQDSKDSYNDGAQPKITRVGYERIMEKKRQLAQNLEDAKIALQTASSRGDLSENADYHANKEDIHRLTRELDHIDRSIGRAVVMETQNYNNTIGFGTEFLADVAFIGNNTKCVLVGDIEAEVLEGRFSETNEIGRALIGKKANDIIIINGCEIKILKIL